MDDDKQTINPYSPSAELELGTAAPGPVQDEGPNLPASRSLLRTSIRWFVVCVISALPSFVVGMAISQNQIAAMVIGILIFAFGYTWADYATAKMPFRQNRRVSRTLKIAYGTRIAVSIIYPIGLFLDMFCGMLSVSLTQVVSDVQLRDGGAMGFAATLFTTLVQGVVLNVVLAVYASLVYAIQWLVAAIRH
ncbi:MAG: hypothetical protein ACR2NZ_22095 [Rubripirellula sp.]